MNKTENINNKPKTKAWIGVCSVGTFVGIAGMLYLSYLNGVVEPDVWERSGFSFSPFLVGVALVTTTISVFALIKSHGRLVKIIFSIYILINILLLVMELISLRLMGIGGGLLISNRR